MLQFFRRRKIAIRWCRVPECCNSSDTANCNSLVPGTGMLQFFRLRKIAILRYQAPRCCDSHGGSGMKAAELTIEVVCQNLPGSCFNDTHGENPKKVGPIY